MEKQKLLFADLYRLLNSVKSNSKLMAKDIDELLFGLSDWNTVTEQVNGMIETADRIRRVTEAMMVIMSQFLGNGPYEGQRAGSLPLETIAEGEDAKREE